MGKTKTVNQYLRTTQQWQTELKLLRTILLDTPLTETIKWGMPCYTYNGKNVVGMSGFKSYFGLWFHQGALLADKHHKLINAQEGKTKALRQWRMTHARDIKPRIIRRYVKESIANIHSQQEIKPARASRQTLPPELNSALDSNPRARSAFAKLTPGKRREYAEHIAQAKHVSTKLRRIDKALPLILKGVGLHDKYR
ncbi:MAG: DUF1801 domain-containing protein [Pseudomonadota bacterium]